MNQLDFVSDNLLSTNDAEVIAKKRENFKKIVFNSIKIAFEEFETLPTHFEFIADQIVQKTFDAGVVN